MKYLFPGLCIFVQEIKVLLHLGKTPMKLDVSVRKTGKSCCYREDHLLIWKYCTLVSEPAMLLAVIS